jgi:repressor LexA
METLTDRQQEILDFLRDYQQREGVPPTAQEIAQAFGFQAVRAAQKHLQALEAKGVLQLVPGKARGIRLNLPSSSAHSDYLSLPVLGRVAAGRPIGADAEIEREILLDRALFFPKPDYLLKVKGDSMRDDGIFDGDLIAVHRTADAQNNQIVVARVDGEITVKRLKKTRDRILLLPRNPDYQPIEVMPDAEFAIEGLYCGLLRGA